MRAGVQNSGCVEASEVGRLVEETRGSGSRNTTARVRRAAQIGEAEIGQVPVEHTIVLVEQSS